LGINNKGVILVNQLVNGVQLLEIEKNSGDSIEDREFHLAYEEHKYFNRPIHACFLQVNVIGYGLMWMFSIKDVPYSDYVENHTLYALALGEIHNRILPYPNEKYVFAIEQCILADHEDKIFR
jgi:hypothetical protein